MRGNNYEKIINFYNFRLNVDDECLCWSDAPKSIAVKSATVQAEQNNTQAKAQTVTQGVKLAMQVGAKDVTIALADNVATQRLIMQLPEDLEFKDFNNTDFQYQCCRFRQGIFCLHAQRVKCADHTSISSIHFDL